MALLCYSSHVKIAAILGLGLAYAGSQNADLIEPLTDILQDFSLTFELNAFAALSLGMIFLGSGNDEIFSNLIGILIAKNEDKKDLIDSPYLILYTLGMSLLLFGLQKDADMMLEMTQINEFSPEMNQYFYTLISACAYAGSGNVLKVQEMMLQVAKAKEEIHHKVQVSGTLKL